MFSSRTPPDLAPNRLTTALQAARTAGRPLIDLTESNPTRARIEYPPDLLTPLADPRGLTYTPHPFGLPEARQAVAETYAARGVDVSAGRIVLTASTSEAYGLLFKLLADAGDEVLVPRPSYPLFEHLTRLDLVTSRPYELEYHGRWDVDVGAIERATTGRTRAILVVSPNNPTGSYVNADELAWLTAWCGSRGMALIADEVFADYELVPGCARAAASVAGQAESLAFSLGGLSKSIGLPQAKLAWIAVSGPGSLVDSALERLELICDTYLSVSTPIQAAASDLLARGAVVRDQIRHRIASNGRDLCARAVQAPSCRVLPSEGGWSAVIQVPSYQSEEALVVDLLERDGVLVHPGYFFDFPGESFLVVSLLTPQPAFSEGMDRILRRFESPRSSE